MNKQASDLIPVTILTGFLGSGKTTLLNHILKDQHGKRIAVIENEFGEVGIDNELVIGVEEEIFEMNNGCICCTVRGDLIRTLNDLAKRKEKFDYILIETTGLADPAPVAQTFFVDEKIAKRFRLDGIVTVVDAKHVWQHIEDSSECKEQIAFADVLLLNKSDLVSKEELDKLEQKIRSMNALVKMYRTVNAELDVEKILSTGSFELNAKLEIDPAFLEEESPFEWGGVYDLAKGTYSLHFKKGPDPTMDMLVLPLESEDDLVKAEQAAKSIFEQSGELSKALVPSTTLYTLDVSGDDTIYPLSISKPGLHAVFTQHMPEEFSMQFKQAQGGLCVPKHEKGYASHTHDSEVGSIAIVEDGELDVNRFNTWLDSMLMEKGPDIFRMKGVLNFRGCENRVIIQGVHMLVGGDEERAWQEGERRTNKLVFIGRNLPESEIRHTFSQCFIN